MPDKNRYLGLGQGIVIKLPNPTEFCTTCEEDKKPDYELGEWDDFMCRECRLENNIELEDMGVTF